jgi:hypothetical protein
MFKNLTILTVIVLALSAVPAFGQVKKFKWDDFSCSYEGTYDAAKVSLAQIKDTLRLIRLFASVHEGFKGAPVPTVSADINQQYAEIESFDLVALTAEYSSRVAEVKNLKLGKSKYWESMRQKKLKDLEATYQFYKTTLLAWKDPGVLKQYPSAPECVAKYADPLINGGDTMLKSWAELTQSKQKDNAFPKRLLDEYERQLASPDKFRYAREELMTFGWWNCANHALDHTDRSDQMEKEFKKLFRRVRTLQCEEP